MAVTAVILAALEPEIATAQAGGAVYTDVDAAHISLAISHAKMHANVLANVTPAVVAASSATVKTANTQPASPVTYPADTTTSGQVRAAGGGIHGTP